MSVADTYDKRLATAASWFNEAAEEMAAARAELRRSLEARHARPGRKIGQCGSPAGYRNHQRYGEVQCAACNEAWTWDRSRYANPSGRAA